MKEKIQKMAEAQAKAITLLKEAKTDEAVAALEETATAMAELATEAETLQAESEATAAQLDEVNKSVAAKDEEIKKWANMNISTDTVADMLKELKSISAAISEVTTVAKSTATADDLKAMDARLEAIEKAGNSRQIADQQRDVVKATLGIDLDPRKMQ